MTVFLCPQWCITKLHYLVIFSHIYPLFGHSNPYLNLLKIGKYRVSFMCEHRMIIKIPCLDTSRDIFAIIKSINDGVNIFCFDCGHHHMLICNSGITYILNHASQ